MKHSISIILKLLVTILAAAVLTATFSACVPNDPSSVESSTPEESPIQTPIESEPESSEETDPETEPVTDPETEPETEPIKTPITLNVGSYNIAHGSAVKLKMNKLGEDIKEKELDIVGIQEVDQLTSRSMKIDTMKKLSESSGLPYYAFFKAIDLQGGEYGVGILSKYPIIETNRTELYSGDEEQRVLGHAVIDVDGTSINFLVTHLSFEAKSLRDKQYATIGEITANMDNFIVVGDFNTNDFTEYAPIKNSDMVNNAKSSILTFPSPTPKSSIDNIVFSADNWTFGKPSVLPNGNSDHCMLYATGTFDPNQ